MGLTLTVLGSSGSYPGPGQACSGYLVRGEGTTVLVDAGSGTLANLQRHTTLTDVDAVVITHEHPDHWTDLTGFYVASRYYLGRTRVPVYAPALVRERVYYNDEPLDWCTVTDGDRVTVGGLRLGFSRTNHGPETLAVRVDGAGRSLAYSSDTAPGWSFSGLGDGIHLGLCEATFLEDDEGKADHLSARQAGEMARAAGVERLLLTHLEPGTDRDASAREGAATFGRPVEVAEDNKEYEI